MTHGTVNAYVNLGCRCGDCCRANTEYRYARGAQERMRARRLAAGQCVACGQPATVGARGSKRYCDGCRNLMRVSLRARRQRARVAA